MLFSKSFRICRKKESMFRSLAGFKAQYHDLTLIVVAEFDEWRVLVYGAGVTIHGTRQFGEKRAKEHALQVADQFLGSETQGDVPGDHDLQWQQTGPNDWMVWRG
jgi:hypothetical protein